MEENFFNDPQKLDELRFLSKLLWNQSRCFKAYIHLDRQKAHLPPIDDVKILDDLDRINKIIELLNRTVAE